MTDDPRTAMTEGEGRANDGTNGGVSGGGSGGWGTGGAGEADITAAEGGDSGATGLNSGMATGESIGAYRLLGVLGSGGFGVVYEAEQVEPVRRRVALKVIKPGMDSHAVVTRFEAERQALAVMDHPCIAKVFDGGVSPAGRPYFVMELVKGVPITEHCNRSRLKVEERIGLFIRVCEAVQHAHAKGVVHRDIKPSNILVQYEDGVATPKVIDFGVAKALNQQLTAEPIFTMQGVMIGTPEYMSPEQAEMSGQDIDTRSDIYSLGVVLYELLTGAKPFEAMTLREAGYAEIQRIIREVEPSRPSTRWASIMSDKDPSAATDIAKDRRTEARSLASVLRRDLDWVVMKCLEKDRERRYETASALASELRRFLNNEPVQAGPPSVHYRLSKFVKRHSAGVAFGSVAAVALVGGVVVLSVLLRSVRQERDRGERLIEFLEGAALAPPLLEDAGQNASLWDVLIAATGSAQDSFANDPLTQARVLGAIGGSRLHLGDESGSLEPLGQASELIDERQAGSRPWAVRSMVRYAQALGRAGRHDEALAVLDGLDDRAVGVAGQPGHTAAEIITMRAGVLKWAGRLDEAQAEYVRAVGAWTALKDPDSPQTLGARYDAALVDLERGKLAVASSDAGEQEQASRWYRATLVSMLSVLADQHRSLGADDPGMLLTTLEAASLHSRLGEFDQAAALFEDAIAGLTRRLGEVHWRTLQARANLGSMHYRQGEYQRAIDAYAPLIAAYRATGRMATSDAFIVAKAHAWAHAKLGRPLDGVAGLEGVHAAASTLAQSGLLSGVTPAQVAQEIVLLLEQGGDGEGAERWRGRPTGN